MVLYFPLPESTSSPILWQYFNSTLYDSQAEAIYVGPTMSLSPLSPAAIRSLKAIDPTVAVTS